MWLAEQASPQGCRIYPKYCGSHVIQFLSGIGIGDVPLPSKQERWVRFPHPAPYLYSENEQSQTKELQNSKNTRTEQYFDDPKRESQINRRLEHAIRSTQADPQNPGNICATCLRNPFL